MAIFITFEGPEGSGKTSVLKEVAKRLQNEGVPIVLTREPGGTPIAEKIRHVILDRDETALDPRAEALLFAASRRQHLVELIWPSLEQGINVLCDRFIDSSMAYQGGGRHLGVDEILTINTFATEGRLPDLTLLFDLSPEVGLARIAKNKNREVNRLDLEELNFHRQVRQTYLELAQRWPHRYEIINAEKSFLEVCECAYQVIIRHLKDNS